MAQSGKPWHICDDCLEPLADDLFSISRRLWKHFDIAKRDRLESEYREIDEQADYSHDRLTEAQRKRLDELSRQMQSQTEPPLAWDVDFVYRKYRIELATDWLKFNVSVEYADDFKRTLLDAKQRFSALEFKACQIINGDEGKESTIVIRYAIRRLIDRHYELLREQFPNHEYQPDREELPDDLRAFEVEILDEYTETENQLREAGNCLRRVSALVRAKMKKADVGAIQRQIVEGFPAAQARLAGRDITDTITEAGNAAHRDEVEPTLAESDVAHSTDFRSVRWFGTLYSFTQINPRLSACYTKTGKRGRPMWAMKRCFSLSIPRPHPPVYLLSSAIIRHGGR